MVSRGVAVTGRGRGYHTSLPVCVPDRKAKIEKAVDTIKEKKKEKKQKVRIHLVIASVGCSLGSDACTVRGEGVETNFPPESNFVGRNFHRLFL